MSSSSAVFTWWAMHEESQLVWVALNPELALLPGKVVHLCQQTNKTDNKHYMYAAVSSVHGCLWMRRFVIEAERLFPQCMESCTSVLQVLRSTKPSFFAVLVAGFHYSSSSVTVLQLHNAFPK